MKIDYCFYIVYFQSGSVEWVYTNSRDKARIIAQAEQINAGNNYSVKKIIKQ